jgi:hypothetical protein
MRDDNRVSGRVAQLEVDVLLTATPRERGGLLRDPLHPKGRRIEAGHGVDSHYAEPFETTQVNPTVSAC